MTIDERIRNSETRQFKMVFQNTLNDHDTLFGGIALKWMDEVAYITATRFTRMRMVTISSEKVEFIKAIKCGSIVEIIGKVIKIKNVRLDIKVEIYMEIIESEIREKAVAAVFTFAAVGENLKPIALNL